MMRLDKQDFISEGGQKLAFYFLNPNSRTQDLPEDSILVLSIGVTEHFGYYLPIRLNEKGQRYIEWYWFNGVAHDDLPQDFIEYIDKVVKLLMFL